ncbi:MAG: CHASE domain-containing protein [Pseudomonadaceae bacterium]|nr:CHASE domain-containing protein [Pseudomonadaceae bacterium]
MPAIHASRVPSWGKIILLAAAYVLAGRLALLLAIPPGFVSAMFPPVGIALAAVLIWGYPLLLGVFIGSTLLNLSIGGPLSGVGLAVAGGIALGTTLQCLSACWLIKRLVGFPNSLTEERSIFLLLLIGGPLTCMLSASGGVATLYFSHIISATQMPASWLTWWVGDSIGVLIATPLMFILFAQPRPLWRSRIGNVGLPLLISCSIMVLVFIRASHAEEQQLRERFHQQSKLITTAVKNRFELYSRSVQSVERLFAASQQVSREDFEAFVGDLPSLYPGVRALGWNLMVSHPQRASYEAAMQAQGFAGFQITERNSSGNFIRAGVRDYYAPVTYIVPLATNTRALGYDIASELLRQQAMQRARDSGTLAMTAPITLVQDTQQEPGVLLFYPVYRHPATPTDAANRAQELDGYATAVVRINELLEAAVSDYSRADFQLQLHDITDAEPVQVYGNNSTDLPTYAQPLVWQESWTLGGRTLQLSVAPSLDFLQHNQSRQSWAQLVGGLLLCSLLGGFLLSMTGRAEQVRRLVKQRTLELSAILENAAEAILIFDQQGQLERANPAANSLFGYPGEQLLRQPLENLLPALQGDTQAALEKLLGTDVQVQGRHADTHPLQLEISLSRFALPGRELYICLLRDIAARKQVEQLKNEFIATVSHELRTPLTSIKGSLGLLVAGVFGPLPEQAQALVEIAQSNSERLVSLVNDILDIEKLEFGQTQLQLTPTDLNPLLQQALAQNQGYADSFNVHLRLDNALPWPLLVAVDTQRLQQVLSNLISNAVKFSSADGRVDIYAHLLDGQVEVAVRDYGVGIADEFRARIFQKFAQADGSDTRTRGGTGLGLSICKTLMERMQGEIGYHSVLGEGSTFYLRLPLA